MDKKRLSLEDALLQKIKDGNGTVIDILNLTIEYNVSVTEVSGILKTLIKRNQVIKSGDKYVIKKNLKNNEERKPRKGG